MEAQLEIGSLEGEASEASVLALLHRSAAFLRNLPSLVEVQVPAGACLHIVGDIHGQLAELLTVLQICGIPKESKNFILFNGDFVDRGPRSVEVMLVLLSLLLGFPGCVFLNRGNHETRSLNKAYGFENEVLSKYSAEVFEAFQEVFLQLPLAHVVNGRVLVIHGGLPHRDGVLLRDIAAIDRRASEPRGLARDLLWSDPMSSSGRKPSPRGAGVLYGPDVSAKFCEDNGLLCCVRSHEVVQSGFSWLHDCRCLTVFSAANYVGQAGNLGAVCHIRPRPDIDLQLCDLQCSTFEGALEPTFSRSRL